MGARPIYVTVYEDDDIVLKHHDPGHGDVFVTFTVRSGKILDGSQPGFGEGVLEKHGFAMLCFIAKWDHWYQCDGMALALERARQIIATRDYSNVISYGSSMGAYAAGATSAFIGATQVIMLAPQFTIDARKYPHEKRWALEQTRIVFARDDMATSLSPTAKKWVIFDPRHFADTLHARLFEEHGSTLVPLPFSSHGVADVLARMRLLRQCVVGIARGEFTAAVFRNQFRQARRLSAEYWSFIADYAAKKRTDVALNAAANAISLKPGEPVFYSRRIGVFMKARRYPEAAKEAADAVAIFPKHESLWKALAESSSRIDHHDAAIEAAERAVLLRPDRADMHITHLSALARAKKYECMHRKRDEIYNSVSLTASQSTQISRILASAG